MSEDEQEKQDVDNEEDESEEEEVEEEEEDADDEEEEDEDADDDFEDEETSREIVVPGEVLSKDLQTYIPGRGTILSKDGKKIVSLHIGLKQIKKNYINVIPLRGIYTPQPGDKIIGIVTDKNPVKYRLDINAKFEGQLKPKNTIKSSRHKYGRGGRNRSNVDLSTKRFKIGDILVVKVLSANRLNKPELTTVGKFLGKKDGGVVITIDPPKIPRVIGRNGSMIKMLKRLTNTHIFVTQNGRIWIKGEDLKHESLLIDAIRKIAREAHTVGLTDRIEEYLKNQKKERGLA